MSELSAELLSKLASTTLAAYGSHESDFLLRESLLEADFSESRGQSS